MNARIRQGHAARALFAVLLLCVLAIRVAVPVGYMPTQGARGIVISLCTGEGAVRMVLPVERQDDGTPHSAKDKPCEFAAGLGGGLTMPSAPALPILAIIWRPVLMGKAIADLTVHRLAAPPPPAQAPPAHA